MSVFEPAHEPLDLHHDLVLVPETLGQRQNKEPNGVCGPDELNPRNWPWASRLARMAGPGGWQLGHDYDSRLTASSLVVTWILCPWTTNPAATPGLSLDRLRLCAVSRLPSPVALGFPRPPKSQAFPPRPASSISAPGGSDLALVRAAARIPPQAQDPRPNWTVP
ncbi:hypothetical protein CkaCkLH20_13000 [Colletotrichum karsti]|uniref:Uncharacterized protein n=1 Tax=Colletotrichum karsti TaxID=1095194 RepID=A0A9P6I095_9PEZI|nr:uncharacterized protein CkaCkLH20_13000 [Colletotrichum karsti]KAF9869515.1 hypothetical protein CkaCkLH20_13000 [Colletotrichum karsti]